MGRQGGDALRFGATADRLLVPDKSERLARHILFLYPTRRLRPPVGVLSVGRRSIAGKLSLASEQNQNALDDQDACLLCHQACTASCYRAFSSTTRAYEVEAQAKPVPKKNVLAAVTTHSDPRNAAAARHILCRCFTHAFASLTKRHRPALTSAGTTCPELWHVTQPARATELRRNHANAEQVHGCKNACYLLQKAGRAP